MGEYIGKYRGVVLDNRDPDRMGRITVQVADVSDVQPTTWAMPCVPFAGIRNGFFAVPAIGSGVWIEFEQGDADYPIWTGGFWGSSDEVPALALTGTDGGVQSVVIQTVGQNTLMISDMDGPTGGILLQSSTGALIAINDTGITISNGHGATIVMSGPAVTVNQGALEVI